MLVFGDLMALDIETFVIKNSYKEYFEKKSKFKIFF
jgi:hypothetical protein